jgi:hypothetical protein
MAFQVRSAVNITIMVVHVPPDIISFQLCTPPPPNCWCITLVMHIKIMMFLVSKVRRVRRADNFTAIYEPIV